MFRRSVFRNFQKCIFGYIECFFLFPDIYYDALSRYYNCNQGNLTAMCKSVNRRIYFFFNYKVSVCCGTKSLETMETALFCTRSGKCYQIQMPACF